MTRTASVCSQVQDVCQLFWASPPTPFSPFPPVLLNIDLVIKILMRSGPAAPEPWQCRVLLCPHTQDEGRISRQSMNSRLQKLSPERRRPEHKESMILVAMHPGLSPQAAVLLRSQGNSDRSPLTRTFRTWAIVEECPHRADI